MSALDDHGQEVDQAESAEETRSVEQAATPKIGAVAAPGMVPPPPPTAPPTPNPDAGKVVEGYVVAVSAEEAELRLDDGRTAVITRRNFGLNDEPPSDIVAVGDRAIGAILAREDPKSRIVLSRTWALKKQAWDRLKAVADSGEAVTCKVTGASSKGVVVDAGVRGFVPASHLEVETPTDLEAYVGQMLELKVLELDERREKLVLSRRAILLRQQRKEAQDRMSALTVGAIERGTVASIADYGAFVDLGGISGLVHLSELSWYRVAKPSDVVSVGDEVEVKVLDIKPKKKRIGLSIRQTTPDPLEEIPAGSVVEGTVSRLVDFGAFVAVEGFEGLVHLSELAEFRVTSAAEIVAPGDQVRVKVLSVDPGRRRLELSIRRAAEFDGSGMAPPIDKNRPHPGSEPRPHPGSEPRPHPGSEPTPDPDPDADAAAEPAPEPEPEADPDAETAGSEAEQDQT